jgi:hypothetical protein
LLKKMNNLPGINADRLFLEKKAGDGGICRSRSLALVGVSIATVSTSALARATSSEGSKLQPDSLAHAAPRSGSSSHTTVAVAFSFSIYCLA